MESITHKEKHGRGFRYLVKWKGYLDSENTYIAASELKKTAKELVAAYERGDSAEDQQAASRACRAANRDSFRAPVESANAIASLEGEAKEVAQAENEARVRR